MLLPDEVELADGKAVGKVTVRGDEWFLQGHFPGQPVVPGVMLCEMMAQTCCVLFAGEEHFMPFFTGLNNVKFRNKVVPGDTITFTCEITRQKGPFYFAKGSGRVNDQLCVSGEFSFAVVKE